MIDNTNLATGSRATFQPQNRAITSTQMYKIEQNAHSKFGVLRVYMMENAGHGLADFIRNKFNSRGQNVIRVIAVCGRGNNGGDSFVAARHLSADPKYRVSVILLGSPLDLRTDEAKINWEIISKMNSIQSLSIYKLDRRIENKICDAHIIIDGIFGTGIKEGLSDPYASAIRCINRSNAYVIAVDIPSGLDPNTGTKGQDCVKADATVTFHRLKLGLLKNRSYVGRIHVEQIGIPRESERSVLR